MGNKYLKCDEWITPSHHFGLGSRLTECVEPVSHVLVTSVDVNRNAPDIRVELNLSSR
ncbi:hypothetical protein M378DRAFT_160023 [Amanita muscaria Koide BX008]|uniref:Uncharacterized protein n=1 Tax=Amanita muscaria (strain Koide BX008) TaxID=946122 RepID=A0A0C2SUI4_AMAMK|nr:hypothetical protein M378DRAFT_160023 [Amanita muscaria Koide BX008]